MREAASPSFFNPAEAVVVLDYIKQLVKEGVQPRNIGVITPYRYYWIGWTISMFNLTGIEKMFNNQATSSETA